MKVLVACEESQAVTKEFRALGHEAYSCDIEPCGGGHPEWHLQQDVTPLLEQEWDMVIAFPPCTHLCVSGAAHFAKKRADGRQQQGIDFFMKFANCNCERVVIENPVGIMSTLWREPDQKIQPWSFGDPFQKTTCLWLKNVPRLIPTHMDAPLFGMSIDKGEMFSWIDGKTGKKKTQPKWFFDALSLSDHERAKIRSRTFPGIARAMASQWGRIKVYAPENATAVVEETAGK